MFPTSLSAQSFFCDSEAAVLILFLYNEQQYKMNKNKMFIKLTLTVFFLNALLGLKKRVCNSERIRQKLQHMA
jgi:hypothetical protein